MIDDDIAEKPCREWASADGVQQEKRYNNPLLNEREKTHGDWKVTASTAQCIKALWEGNTSLSASQREALDMIATKIARLICGDPRHEDTVVDIVGYATLMLEDMRRENLDA